MLRNSLTVGVVNAVFLLLGFASQAVMAAVFGTSSGVDAYFLALMIASYLPTAYQSSFGDALVPAYLSSRDRQPLVNAILTLTLIISAMAGLVLTFPLETILRSVVPSISAGQLGLSMRFGFVMTLLPLGMCISHFMTGLYSAEKRFLLPKAATLFGPVVTIAGVGLFGRSHGEFTLACAVVVGNLFQAILLLLGYPSLLANYRFTLRPLLSSEASRYFRTALPMLFVIGVGGFHVFVDRAFAASLGAGQIAALAYADRVNAMVTTLLLMPITVVALPYLAEADVRRDFLTAFLPSLRLVFLIFIPVGTFAACFSGDIIRFIYMRGEFSDESASLVAATLAMSMIGLAFAAVGSLVGRSFVARGATTILVPFSILALLLKVGLNTVLVPRLALPGVGLATSLGYVVMGTVTLLVLVGRSNVSRLAREVGWPLLAIAGAGVGLMPALALTRLLPWGASFWGLALKIFASGTTFLFVYGLIVFAVGRLGGARLEWRGRQELQDGPDERGTGLAENGSDAVGPGMPR